METVWRKDAADWLTVIEPDVDGEANMERDIEMARRCAVDGRHRLRLYSWSPWTLSLGHHQTDVTINNDLLGERGWGVVRRPTGGRAVFHAEEITYAVAMRGGGEGIHQTYAAIVAAIRRGLERLGAHDLEFSRSRPDFRSHYEREESASCFSASALNELTWRGKKIVGSAQRRYDGALLQHGSILLDSAHLMAIDILYPDAAPERRNLLKQRLSERTATLREVLGGTLPPFDTIASALAEAFRATGFSSS